ncbi:hypothetical protein EJ04DRAFT_508277 [Polyplosphaeria fusca]|uniref:Uncharacterized protein n=1 Tax=Polyplosphaeria fusca TaxID=682080 RepID=A0A9P4V869_9PLEO|nr:hypothetical protein EJ04DRAFT_508277 [Polyplosphaeria fusca]
MRLRQASCPHPSFVPPRTPTHQHPPISTITASVSCGSTPPSHAHLLNFATTFPGP